MLISCGSGSLFHDLPPLKFNMEPENQPLEKEIPNLENHHFWFHSLNFGGCTTSFKHIQVVVKASDFPKHQVHPASFLSEMWISGWWQLKYFWNFHPYLGT